MIDVMQYVTIDDERTAQERQLRETAAERAAAETAGRALFEGSTMKDALAAGDTAREAVLSREFTCYRVDTAGALAATIDYVVGQYDELARMWRRSDGDLAKRSLANDALALFALNCRQVVMEASLVDVSAYSLALTPRDAFDDEEDGEVLRLRADALEAARRFFTEALHQKHGGGLMLVHWTKAESWRL